MGALQDRILANIVRDESGCWIWVGYADPDYYGRINIKGVPRLAHRISYETFVGTIPPKHDVHHTCENTLCVAPSHLKAVPNTQHQKLHIGAVTHCIWGHEFTAENTYVTPQGRRRCKACHRRRERERREHE